MGEREWRARGVSLESDKVQARLTAGRKMDENGGEKAKAKAKAKAAQRSAVTTRLRRWKPLQEKGSQRQRVAKWIACRCLGRLSPPQPASARLSAAGFVYTQTHTHTHGRVQATYESPGRGQGRTGAAVAGRGLWRSPVLSLLRRRGTRPWRCSSWPRANVVLPQSPPLRVGEGGKGQVCVAV